MSSTIPSHRRGILRTPSRRTALGALALVSAAGLALTGPIMSAFGAAAGTVNVQTSQTVKADLTNTGKLDSGHVFTQVAVSGKGAVVVKNPTSTQGLRNLNGWGSPSTENGKTVYNVKVDGGTKTFRTVANFTKDLPVSVDITYRLDGRKISPDDLAGKSGRLGVSYTIKNTTAEPTEITYPDGHGKSVTESVDLVTPYVGQLSVALPSSFKRIGSDNNRADQAGDGHGGRLLTWTMVLFEPIGQTVQRFGYTAQVDDVAIPPASIQLVPVSPENHPELKFGQDGFSAGAQSGRDVTDAGVQIDDNLLKLQAGATKLLDGLTQLQSGSETLAAGLVSGADAAIPGSQQLAAGVQVAADGATQVADGADQVAAGNAKLAAGLNELAGGAAQLSSGADQLSTGFNDPNSETDLTDGSQALAAALGLISSGLHQLNNATSGLPALRTGAIALQTAMNTQIIPAVGKTTSPCDPSDPTKQSLLGCMQPILAGVTQLGTSPTAGLPALQAGVSGVQGGLVAVKGGVAQVQSGLAGALTPTTGSIDALAAAIKGSGDCGPNCQFTVDALISSASTPPSPPFPAGTQSLRQQTAAANVGLQQVLAGIGPANDLSSATLNGGLNQVAGGLAQTVDEVNNTLLVGLQGINAGLLQLRAGLTNADFNGGTSNPQCNPALAPPKPGYCGFTEGLAQLVAGLTTAVGAVGQLDAGAATASAGAGDLADGIATAGDGAAQLSAGLKQVGQKAPEAVAGANQLADGSEKVAAGANALAAGLNDQLAPGAEQLAAGLGSLTQAADGAQQLSDGLTQAKDGNQQIVDGTGELSARGSKKLIAAGDDTARTFARQYAIMKALDEKGAKSGMPYGTPTGSQDNRAAYDLTIAPVGHSGSTSNPGRGIIALIVLGAGAFLATSLRGRFA